MRQHGLDFFFFFFAKRQTVNFKNLGPVPLDYNFIDFIWAVREINLSHYCQVSILNCKMPAGTCNNLVYI